MIGAVVLAAGKGTRLRSSRAKVLHEVAGRSLLGWALEALRPLGLDRVVVVVGHQADDVAAAAEAMDVPGLVTVLQDPQNGTGHAVRMAVEAGALDGLDEVLVLPGDVPGITTETLTRLRADRGDAAASVLTTRMPDPTGYGRIVRDDAGNVTAIVEHRDATDVERAIDEVNTAMFAFRTPDLLRALSSLTTENAQGEEYLTDTVAALAVDGGVRATEADPDEVSGVNDMAQLAEVEGVLRQRILLRHMAAGVRVVDPATTYVDAEVVVEADATILPGTMLEGRTHIAAGATVGPHSRLLDTVVGEGASVTYTVATEARIGPEATVGPYTHLRTGTVLERGSKAGGFVEMKKAHIGEGSKVPHLSYVGDAEVGKGVNLGAGTITVNYDGFDKHTTTIGDGAFVGSDSMLVAPIDIGTGAFVGAGSTITTDVPADALVVERAQPRTIDGWAARRRARHERDHEREE
ncbi:bifunctional UDP-N-acetylglucosamine diphosphorylase/glucosamine-1-phosphate N-acetyltransferase GlmU [Euzebya rosea]|uniref:bifunctional UDP-N-acetylglucosamine diphosphorylase/glucosamine-1-phosphate N-acetyltransferase GlmU n=1 Tax=Euzebya rosea TaxID=2052804 RepID=UPI000D3E5D11|nr:bifunctional UDP-N-acetylglucosamine diphosphorylase/glucosamine-1-phosphate N-acetyltransferase GlmU [Euzebya rosea]